MKLREALAEVEQIIETARDADRAEAERSPGAYPHRRRVREYASGRFVLVLFRRERDQRKRPAPVPLADDEVTPPHGIRVERRKLEE